MCRRVFICFLVCGVVAAVLIGFLNQGPDPFKVNKTGYWGTASVKNVRAAPEDDPVIYKFSVHAPEEALLDLKRRLASTKLAEPLQDSRFEYGFNAHELRRVVDHWKDRFDWRQQERLLNAYQHYHTTIEGIRVHFMYARPKADAKTKVYTLLMIHGWPGSVVEFLKIAKELATPKQGVAFEVICPSIPGYGFSEAPHKKGFNSLEAARVFVKLMDRLGRKRFYVQGGDWGAMIAKLMATYYSDRVLGAHMNMMDVEFNPLVLLKLLIGSFYPSLVLGNDERLVAASALPLWPKLVQLLRESGYMHLHSTKPDTIGLALLNSPAGLAAYILEKFSTWTAGTNVDREDGGLTDKYTYDELLANVMLYWLTDCIGSSARFYKENFAGGLTRPTRVPVTVPAGFSVFPEDLLALPKSFVGHAYHDVVTFEQHSSGGHFAAFEKPDVLERDVRHFVAAVEARNASAAGPFAAFPFVDVGPQLYRATVTFGPSRPAGGQRFEPVEQPKAVPPPSPPPVSREPEVKPASKPVESRQQQPSRKEPEAKARTAAKPSEQQKKANAPPAGAKPSPPPPPAAQQAKPTLSVGQKSANTRPPPAQQRP
ncbi:epoxide hydrolase 1 isoform X2 [Rhipicephalus sanguineus]|uniref:epoxide hydrolase 1 isoform X2 n=1 Tax=Rhipicephalus sanguineus TaxID=34632 RepID=UPI0018945645|nr:epoxide hydrolase 1 isoform X2 [Rhipicephalus sanguineus]